MCGNIPNIVSSLSLWTSREASNSHEYLYTEQTALFDQTTTAPLITALIAGAPDGADGLWYRLSHQTHPLSCSD